MPIRRNKAYSDLKLFMGQADAALSAQELGFRVVEKHLQEGPFDSERLKNYASQYGITVNSRNLNNEREIISLNNILLLFGRFEQFVYELNNTCAQNIFPPNEKITNAIGTCFEELKRKQRPQTWAVLELVVSYYRILRDINAHPRLSDRLVAELSAFSDKIETAQKDLDKVIKLPENYSFPKWARVGHIDCIVCSRLLKEVACRMTTCLSIFEEDELISLGMELKSKFSSCVTSNKERFEEKSIKHIQCKYCLDAHEAKSLYELAAEGF